MNRTEEPTKSTEGAKSAGRRPLLTILSLLAIIASSCGSEAAAPTDAELAARPAPDAAVVEFTEAWGSDDAETAWGYISPACREGGVAAHHATVVNGYATANPGATAINIVAVTGNSDFAAISYDVENGSGEFVEFYNAQLWKYVDGAWYKHVCGRP